eukprot:286232-Rhodomonas_salina.1
MRGAWGSGLPRRSLFEPRPMSGPHVPERAAMKCRLLSTSVEKCRVLSSERGGGLDLSGCGLGCAVLRLHRRRRRLPQTQTQTHTDAHRHTQTHTDRQRHRQTDRQRRSRDRAERHAWSASSTSLGVSGACGWGGECAHPAARDAGDGYAGHLGPVVDLRPSL